MKIFNILRGLPLSLALLVAAGAAQAQTCPDWQPGGQQIVTDADTAWTPQTFAATAGGPLDLGACPGVPGMGRITSNPTFSLAYDDRGMGRDLDLRLSSRCDTVLLVNDATAQWHFNDDADGTLDARLRLPLAPSGRYDIWVGTFDGQSCQANLIVETFPGSEAAAAGACPDWRLGGDRTLTLTGTNPQGGQVTAGGTLDLFARAGACGLQDVGHGHFTAAPQFTLTYEAPSPEAELRLTATADCDTVLLVNDPSEAWNFNDDFDGVNPGIYLPAAPSGQYDIWVGTFGSQSCAATLTAVAVLPGAAPRK